MAPARCPLPLLHPFALTSRASHGSLKSLQIKTYPHVSVIFGTFPVPKRLPLPPIRVPKRLPLQVVRQVVKEQVVGATTTVDKPTGLGSHKRRALRALRNSQTLPFKGKIGEAEQEVQGCDLASENPVEQAEDGRGEQTN